MLTLRDRMNRLFEDSMPRAAETESHAGTWWPPVDIFEKEDSLVLEAELPGLNREDLDIQIENSNLTLRGERKHEVETREQDYYRIERSYGTFVRTFSLPATIDRGKISAALKDGVLRIVLPKAEEAKPKKLDVKID
jgi:HSP20 family protein